MVGLSRPGGSVYIMISEYIATATAVCIHLARGLMAAVFRQLGGQHMPNSPGHELHWTAAAVAQSAFRLKLV